jgi:hypothetical protein
LTSAAPGGILQLAIRRNRLIAVVDHGENLGATFTGCFHVDFDSRWEYHRLFPNHWGT